MAEKKKKPARRILYRSQMAPTEPSKHELDKIEEENLLSALKKAPANPMPKSMPIQPQESAPMVREPSGKGLFGDMSPTNQRALMAGATPLLVGFLTGNMGDSYEIAAKGLLAEDKRRYEEEDSLMKALRKSIAKSKEKGAVSRFSPQKARSGKGLAFDKHTGKYLDPDTGEAVHDAKVHTYIQPEAVEKRALAREEGKYAGGIYGKEIRKNREDESVFVDKRTGKTEKVFDPGVHKVSPRFEKRADTVTDKYVADMKAIRDVSQMLDESLGLLSKKGILPSKIAIQSIIKKVEGGRMSDEDRRYYISNVSKISAIDERIDEEVDEEVRERLRDEAKAVLAELAEHASNRLTSEAEDRAKGNSRNEDEYRYLMNRFTAGGYKRAQEKPRIKKFNVKKMKTTKDLKSFEEMLKNADDLDALEKAIKEGK